MTIVDDTRARRPENGTATPQEIGLVLAREPVAFQRVADPLQVEHVWLPCVGVKPPRSPIRYYCEFCHVRATERAIARHQVQPTFCPLVPKVAGPVSYEPTDTEEGP